jgi:hypothetical protein
MRQARVDRETLEAYEPRLRQFPIADVREVCGMLGEKRREPGQPAFPELGVLLAELYSRARVRGAAVKSRIYAHWECARCGTSTTGFISPYDHTPRLCPGIPRQGPQKDPVTGAWLPCGEIMTQVERDAA